MPNPETFVYRRMALNLLLPQQRRSPPCVNYVYANAHR
jgi:hypothetical protein